MEVNKGVLNIDLGGVHTNIVSIEIVKPGLSAADFCKRIAVVRHLSRLMRKQQCGFRTGPTQNRLYSH